MTKIGENEEVQTREIQRELHKIIDPLKTDRSDLLVSVVTDYASCNIGAKKKLAKKWPSLCIIACYCHEFNFMTVNVLLHIISNVLQCKVDQLYQFSICFLSRKQNGPHCEF